MKRAQLDLQLPHKPENHEVIVAWESRATVRHWPQSAIPQPRGPSTERKFKWYPGGPAIERRIERSPGSPAIKRGSECSSRVPQTGASSDVTQGAPQSNEDLSVTQGPAIQRGIPQYPRSPRPTADSGYPGDRNQAQVQALPKGPRDQPQTLFYLKGSVPRGLPRGFRKPFQG